MRKFILAIFAVLSMALVSCSTQFGITYGVNLSGDGDGNFKVEFPQGSYAMDGTAKLSLNVGDSLMFNDAKITTKDEVLKSGNKEYLLAMQRVNDSIGTEFNAYSGEGTYDLWIKGYVKEVGTGLVFSIDRHLTNRDQHKNKSSSNREEIICPYIK